jgi:hypothetical protein
VTPSPLIGRLLAIFLANIERVGFPLVALWQTKQYNWIIGDGNGALYYKSLMSQLIQGLFLPHQAAIIITLGEYK